MKVFGYIRSYAGNDVKEKQISDFCEQIGLRNAKVIKEKASGKHAEMVNLNDLLEKNEKFILVVPDTSELFENVDTKEILVSKLEEKDVLLIDMAYPKFDYKMLIEKNCKDCPVEFLVNSIVVEIERYMRKTNKNMNYQDEIKNRIEHWKKSSSGLDTRLK